MARKSDVMTTGMSRAGIGDPNGMFEAKNWLKGMNPSLKISWFILEMW